MKIYFKNKILVIVIPFVFKIFKKIFGAPIKALAIFPFILVSSKNILNNEDYIRHESIHIYQCLETFLIGIYLIGGLQYLYAKIFLKKSNQQAYYYMAHEQEAHQNDRNINYLKERKFGSYYKYLLPKNKKKFVYENGERELFG